MKAPSRTIPRRRFHPGEIIPTGSLTLDYALGIGGLPRGCFSEIAGPIESGKSTLCYHILAEAQKLGGVCALIDTDQGLDAAYAARCGVDIDRLYFAVPDDAEQALDILEKLARSGGLALVILDSLHTLAPRAELQASLGQISPEPPNRQISNMLRGLAGAIRRNQTSVILTQLAEPRRGAIYHRLAESPSRLALKLHAALRLELHPVEKPTSQDDKTNPASNRARMRIKIVKNSLSPCLYRAELDIMYNDRIVKAGEILNLGIRTAVIFIQAAGYTYQGLHLGKERREVLRFLQTQSEIMAQIESDIRQRLLLPFPRAL